MALINLRLKMKKFLKGHLFIMTFGLIFFGSTKQSSAVEAGKKPAPLDMYIGYISESARLKLLPSAESLEKVFATNQIPVKVSLIKAGTITPKSPILWDLGVSNFATVATQLKNKAPITPIFWVKDCYVESMAFTSGGSLAPNSYAGKKVLIFGFGYPTANILQAIYDWGLSDSKLFLTSDRALAAAALADKKVDLLISDGTISIPRDDSFTNVFGPVYDEKKFQVVATSNYKYPCKVLSVVNRLSKKDIEKITKVVSLAPTPFLKRFNIINPKEQKKLEATFNWTHLDKIESKIQTYSEN